jgi:predicted  nucleic acid-binding Zn-ribbon protein
MAMSSLTDALLALQQTDLELTKSSEQIEALPQRAQILSIRKKRKELESKTTAAADLRTKCNQAITRLQTGVDAVRTHIDEEQKKVDASTDYKKTEALTREIEGLAKQLDKLEGDMLTHMEQLDKISDVEARINDATQKLDEQEEALTDQYKKQGGEIMSRRVKLEQLRREYAGRIGADLLAKYDANVKARGGIGVARISKGHCGACGVTLATAQLADLQKVASEADGIAECPHCHRLLVV